MVSGWIGRGAEESIRSVGGATALTPALSQCWERENVSCSLVSWSAGRGQTELPSLPVYGIRHVR